MSDLGMIKTPACLCSDEEGDDAACPVHVACRGCGSVTDVTTCECGIGVDQHRGEQHVFSPMGCTCHLLRDVDLAHNLMRNGGDDDDERDCF